ncbi:DUF6175 family protein [Flavivirga amylovorans]|uniref:DUF6175 family protein n=1 Tax=Flavivirga amylovorans TaxID=870486 RepID=A0ABT8WXX6_9FLAO|nr:DUF6175 family protein [Flavivirga amylovorans]MDO5986244.1 DUF6175 family protein [Flavivirga amylovorans]
MKQLRNLLRIAIVTLLLFPFGINSSYAQCDEDLNVIQPSIMVLPRTKAGEDLRTIIDERPEIRIGISKLTEYLNENHDYQTYDFETKLKALIRDGVITDSQTKNDVKDAVLKNIPADIVMEIDLMYVEADYGNLVRIVLEANVTATGKNMGSSICESRIMRITDIGMLTDLALKGNTKASIPCADEFLNNMYNDWAKIATGGQSLKIDFGIENNSEKDMNYIVPSKKDRLKYVIEDWLKENALRDGYKITISTENKLIVEDFRFSKCDPKTGKRQSTTDIERKLDRFFIQLDLPAKLINSTGSIFVKIL